MMWRKISEMLDLAGWHETIKGCVQYLFWVGLFAAAVVIGFRGCSGVIQP